MKLLAIRGQNLASLAAPFEIDLAAPPLATAGLFAITGPTGAGKSTILDAVCLALFNRLPRLPGERGSLIGREEDLPELRIATTDVRGILSRGAGAGWAEADFVGRDGHSYRARWDVRRARNRPGGKLQQEAQSLLRLDDGQRLGGSPTETRAAIEAVLGLGFEQFRRAVLLAQGDFAAFLKAPAKERAALLEQITGSDLYSRLSKAAYARAQAEKQRLAALEERRSGLPVLDPAGRAALEQAAAAARAEAERAEAAVAVARHARDWHRRRVALEGELAAAEAGHASAAAARQAAEGERRELALLQRLQPLRPRLEESDRAAGDASAAAARAEAAAASVVAAEAAHVAAESDLAQAATGLREREAADLALAPDLERALSLDHDLANLERVLAGAGAARDRAVAEAETDANALADLDADLASLNDAIAGRRRALLERTALAALAPEWPRWLSMLERAEAALATLVDSRKALAGLTGQSWPVEGAGDDIDRPVVAAEEEVVDRQRMLDDTAARAFPPVEGIREARTAAEGERERLRTLRALTDAASRSVGDQSVARADATGRRDQAAVEEAAAAGVEAGLERARAVYSEAEAALHRLHRAAGASAETLRAGLAAGEPCPVCGGVDHPWAGRPGPAFDALAAEQRARVEELAAEGRRLSETLGGHRAAAAAARREAANAEARAAAAAAELAQLEAAWQATAGDGLPGHPAAEGAGALLAVRLAEVEAGIVRLVGEERAAEAHRRQWAAAEAALRVALAVRDLARLLAGLDAVLGVSGPWRRDWRADVTGFRRRLGQGVAEVTAIRTALAEAERRHESGLAARAGIAGRAAASATRRAEAEAALAEVSAGREAVLAERRCLLAGRSVAAVRAEAAAARRQALEAHEGALKIHREGALGLARVGEARDLAAAEAARRCAAAVAARRSFEAALAAAGHDEMAVRALLGRDSVWAETAAVRLAGVDRGLEAAAATLAERQRHLAGHLAAGEAAAGDVAGAEAALAAAEAILGSAREQVYESAVRVRQDDEARVAEAGLAAEIAVRRQSWELWGGLDAVIGSAGGDKFRSFAQGLSLDQLIGHANLQLAGLSRRYRLERAAGSDLELQVADRDMGDEVRSVHSLSGGETFLISLALALGLSALAGGGTGIGTLLIDEGFGALDGGSLDIALSCLEALQADGRSVGVVSHVPAMIERIGVQVRVIAEGGGRSRVVTVGHR